MKTFKIAQLNTNEMDQATRYPHFEEAFRDSGADIITVQEVVNANDFAKMAMRAGYQDHYFSKFLNVKNRVSIVGILSKTPLENRESQRSPNGFCYATTEIEGNPINVFSVHLAWGSSAEMRRLEQAEHIDRVARKLERSYPRSFTVLAGDMNTQPTSRTIRYLEGYDLNTTNDESTLWVDSWKEAGSPENHATSVGSTPQSRATALSIGLDHPETHPDRRIDYIMTRGWSYGKPGYPLDFGYLTDSESAELSDHSGIVSTMILEV